MGCQYGPQGPSIDRGCQKARSKNTVLTGAVKTWLPNTRILTGVVNMGPRARILTGAVKTSLPNGHNFAGVVYTGVMAHILTVVVKNAFTWIGY